MEHRIAIFASGNGTNAEAVMNHFKDHPYIRVVALLTNNPNAHAIERAKKFGVLCEVYTKEAFGGREVHSRLSDLRISHVCLAGYLLLVAEDIIKSYHNKIVNIHPALLPKYGGKGMYGMKVHEAVKASGDKQTGITIHLVNNKYDEGEILAQKTVEILPTDSPQDIANKVHELEHRYYPEVIEKWINSQG